MNPSIDGRQEYSRPSSRFLIFALATIGRIRFSGRAMAAVRPTAISRAKAVVPSGRCESVSRASPPTNAQTRPLSSPTATVQTTASTNVRCGWASPTRRYWVMVDSTMAVTVAAIAATSRVMDDPILGEPGFAPRSRVTSDDRWQR